MNEKENIRKRAIIDANINRVSEGLRVIEDWSRFYIRDKKLTDEIREVKHSLWKIVSSSYPEYVKARKSEEDILAKTEEQDRDNIDDIPKASLNRIKEGIRVLEEMAKLISKDSGKKLKTLRFRIYEIERKFYEKIT
ncbi:MAG: thiamine-phosphate pyrophosphorylase [Elusimicrobiota bacterium]